MDDKQRIMQIIEEKSQEFIQAADHIWETPETRFAVKESVQQHYKVLKREGFDIEKSVGHMDYAYVATWGSGRPVIGITGEYDALGGLSQVADLGEHKPLVEGGNGQGCGHNILGMAAVAAGVGIHGRDPGLGFFQPGGPAGLFRFHRRAGACGCRS